MNELAFKGWTYRVGQYVHLMNPDDAKKPIVGQIWKIYAVVGYVEF